jgi:VIT1/CCC1 family predicted Fe2+/Mn2+ transporter
VSDELVIASKSHHRQISGGGFRAALFGLMDGLVTNVSLILGFAGANPGHSIIRLAGLAGLVSGAFSMGSGEYLSMRAQKELYGYEIDVERRALADEPDAEREELRDIFIERGIEAELAERLSTDLMRDPDLALRTHTREELGIDPSATGSPWIAAFSSFLFFSGGALIPLLPWIVLSRGNVMWWSVGLSAASIIFVGAAVGHYTRRGIVYSALRALVIMGLASAVTYGVGHLVGVS